MKKIYTLLAAAVLAGGIVSLCWRPPCLPVALSHLP
jgi:hypothetical protein